MTGDISLHEVTYHPEELQDRSRAHNPVYLVYLPDRINDIGIQEGDLVKLSRREDEAGICYIKGTGTEVESPNSYKIRTGSSDRLRVTFPAKYREEFIESDGADIFVVEINPADNNRHFRIYKNSDYHIRLEFLNEDAGNYPRIGQPVLLSLSDLSSESGNSPPTSSPNQIGQTIERSNTDTLGYSGGDLGPITITEVHLRRSLMKPLIDFSRPLATPNTQFVFLTISQEDSDTEIESVDSFRILLDDKEYLGSAEIDGEAFYSRYSHGISPNNDIIHPPPANTEENGIELATVGFQVPLNTNPDQAVIEWNREGNTARLQWEEPLIEGLKNPPRFRLVSISKPRIITHGEPFDVDITVANKGGRRGSFNAIVPIIEPARQSHPISLTLAIPANRETTWRGRIQFPPKHFTDLYMRSVGDNVNKVVYQIDWGGGSRNFSVYLG